MFRFGFSLNFVTFAFSIQDLLVARATGGEESGSALISGISVSDNCFF